MINAVTVDNFAALLHYTPVDRASDSMMTRPKAIRFSWLGTELSRLLLGPPGSTDDLLMLQISSGVVLQSGDLQLSCNTLHLLSPCLCFFIVLKRDLFVYHDDSLTS